MKKCLLIYFTSSILVLASCGGGNNNQSQSSGTKFAPKERTSSMSDDARAEAISQKKSELAQEINLDSVLSIHGVTFSVLPPSVDQNLPQAASEKLATRMIQISSQNGIGGLCTNPVLAMVSRVDCVQRELTGTAPQKAIVKYEVTCYCGNFITNDIYASASQTITGVGNTFEDAASKAMNELKNTSEMQKMLSTASERAIKWYSATANVQKFVDSAVSDKNYALAMALLSSVPQQAEGTYSYAIKRNAEVSDLFFQEKADELLAQMEAAINAAQGEYNPEVGAYYTLIPQRSKAYARARQLHDAYVKQVDDVRKDKLAREREVEDQERANAQALAMEELAVQKIKAPYEAQAAIAQIESDAKVGVAQARAEGRKNANTGGFLGLGKLWDGGFNIANRIMDHFGW